MKKYTKFGVLIVAILGTLAWLAVGGAKETSTYYKTVPELKKMGSEAMSLRHLRVAGDVEAGSIVRSGRQVSFTLTQMENKEVSTMTVVYDGTEPLPDTFRDGSQAVAEGKLASDGVFHATKIQAKCASKYEAKPPSAKPAVNTSAAM